MKNLLGVIFLLICKILPAQLQSPEQFLGYKIGAHFTPHHRLTDYVKSVAAASPATIKLQQYGTTNEGRPLMVLFISSAQNIANLEAIRTANIALTENKKEGGTASGPAIVWLSYNVHGNEPSSSEAAMLTLYELANPANTQTKAWLQNTVVVIDPCLNPDGRDRYVAWYNSVAQTPYNVSRTAREHVEPWPRGRTNHYNFDLNRDWAWQTQTESRARVSLFNQWLPQVHVDFHEQGYNEPYYFAPAAEPFHQVITKWQRDFQTTIGRNHARYFDQNGWLYFTRERFDLLYPSYGDTYPIYNGAIGMTYEQGGISAGLGVVTENGDTLTLTDRALHHFTTGISTIEVASKNAAQLRSEFQKYYAAANAGVGTYKSFVLKMQKGDEGKINSLLTLLDRNGIHYFSGKGANLRGYNYDSGKEESFSLTDYDVVVPSAQPKSNLLTVLFEPNPVLTDSATYDITAWSLPYAYGVKAYASKSSVDALSPYAVQKVANAKADADAIGYVLPWTSINSAKVVAQLLQKGIRLRFVTEPFELNGESFQRGAVLILKGSNKGITDLWNTVTTEAENAGTKISPVKSGLVDKGFDFGSSSTLTLNKQRVALLTGEGISSDAAGEVWYFFEQDLKYPLTLLNVSDAYRINWNNYDVVIMPDGAYRFLNDKTAADGFKNWVNMGGHVVALESGVAALSRLDWGLKLKKTSDSDSKSPYENLKRFDSRERDQLSLTTPGSIFKVQLDNTHPLAFGYPDYYYTLKQDNVIYEFFKEDGWNVGVIKKEAPVAGFVGAKLRSRLQNGLLFGVQDMGSGSVTYFTDNVLFRNFWQNGKLLFANAVFFVGQNN